MSEQQTDDGLIAEYVEVLKSKMNDFVEEAVALKARLQYSDRISQEAQKRVIEIQDEIGKREAEIAQLTEQLNEERARPATKEIIKEVIKEVPIMASDDKLQAENDFLKKELSALERKIKKLKSQEMNDGIGTETETFRDSQFGTDSK